MKSLLTLTAALLFGYTSQAAMTQTINFPAIPPKPVGSPPFTLNATATSQLPVTYISTNTTVATVSSNVVTILAVGTTAIIASQPGNANYLAAPNVSQVLLVGTAPAILTQPRSLTNAAGVTALFSFTATGSLPMGIQWLRSGTNIYGATGTTYSIVNPQVANNGTYSLTLSNAFGRTTSSNATLTILNPPIITNQPSATTNFANETLQLRVRASGSAPMAYQWRKEGINLTNNTTRTGTTTATLTIVDCQTSDSGFYDVIITNQVGTNTSVSTKVLIVPPIRTVFIANTNTSPASLLTVPIQLLAEGDENTLGFSVNFDTNLLTFQNAVINTNLIAGSQLIKNYNLVPSGKVGLMLALPTGEVFEATNNELVYLTFRVATNITIATNTTLTFGNSPVYREIGSYDAESLPANYNAGNIAIAVLPTIVTQPQDVTANYTKTATFTVSATGIGISYQWRFNNSPLIGKTTTSLTLTNLQSTNAGDYSVVLSNFSGTVTSATARLTVIMPPVIATQPQPTIVPVGVDVQFICEATGFEPSYQWYRENTPLAGQTEPTLDIFGVITNDSGRYTVVVSNTAGAVSSSPALLTVVGGLEADASPRPTGNGSVSAVDWTQIGLYASSLSSPTNAAEFMRADCSPRATSGDGRITATDWTQAGRYAAGIDPAQNADGPYEPATAFATAKVHRTGLNPRKLTIVTTDAIANSTVTIPVALSAMGDENAFGFSIAFNPNMLTYKSVTRLANLPPGTQLILNTNQTKQGFLGILIGLPIGEPITAGTQNIVNLTFQTGATPSGTSLNFSDNPITREIASASAEVLTADYFGTTLTGTTAKPTLTIQYGKPPTLTLHTSTNGAYAIQTSYDLKNWSSLTNIQVISPSTTITQPSTLNTNQFYRVKP